MASQPQSRTAFGWKRQLRTRMTDDLTLCVEHLAPKGVCQGAVILCHGLSANGLVFDLPTRSLARYLAERGFECFIPDLRGARHSSIPAGGWSLDDYLERDLPALLQLVREQALSERVHWLGHSLGGLLFMMYGSEHPEARIQRVVGIGTAIDYQAGPTMFRSMRRVLPLTRPVSTLPFGAVTRLSATVGRCVELPVERMNFYRPNVEPEVVRTLLQQGFGPVATTLLADLDSTFARSGLARQRGLLRYADLWPRYRFPTQLLAGNRDALCSITAVDETARRIAHVPDVQVKLFGRAYGQQEDYGHYDLIVGRNAPTEVWPVLANWLERS